jgi:hypothetical protein
MFPFATPCEARVFQSTQGTLLTQWIILLFFID